MSRESVALAIQSKALDVVLSELVAMVFKVNKDDLNE
jgi:hypothetical protein